MPGAPGSNGPGNAPGELVAYQIVALPIYDYTHPNELRRMRDIRQGPDGFLYVLVDDDDGAVLRIEPAI